MIPMIEELAKSKELERKKREEAIKTKELKKLSP